jgi:predicted metallo-beta-lactamase superfamily hydrolase
MKVIPLAFDSMGVRSMATSVGTDHRILIDPGLDLAPSRYGLPPSKTELKRAEELSAKIDDCAKGTDIFIITHYHHDHYFPQAGFYRDKVLLLKHPERDINYNQRKRAKAFLNSFGNRVKRIEYADGKEFALSGTKIKFSPPVPHGEARSKSGFVVMCSICHGGEKFVFASDAQGPQVSDSVTWIVEENPDLLIISGHPTYLPQVTNPRTFEECNHNLIEILVRTNIKTIILDHHLTRDIDYKGKVMPTLKKAHSMGRNIITAAEYLGMKPDLLEAKRKQIHQTEAEDKSLES